MERDGIGWDGGAGGWNGMGRGGMGRGGTRRDWMGRDGMGWDGMGWELGTKLACARTHVSHALAQRRGAAARTVPTR